MDEQREEQLEAEKKYEVTVESLVVFKDTKVFADFIKTEKLPDEVILRRVSRGHQVMGAKLTEEVEGCILVELKDRPQGGFARLISLKEVTAEPPELKVAVTAELHGLKAAELHELKVAVTPAAAEEYKLMYPGNEYVDTKRTRLAESLEQDCVAVIKSSYFEECLERQELLGERAEILAVSRCEHFIRGSNLMQQWGTYGAQFLVIFSYAWLTPEHPDPEMFHLQRMVRVLKELKAFHNELITKNSRLDRSFDYASSSELKDLGVIIDYCSLWQRGSQAEDKRSEVRRTEFKAALLDMDVLYAHQEVTAVRLAAVPPYVARKFHDRGWTLFESKLIDGKQPSGHIRAVRTRGEMHWGRLNVLTCQEGFDPKSEFPTGKDFMWEFAASQREPPCSPTRFHEMLLHRQVKAAGKNVSLFTQGGDQQLCSFSMAEYDKAFRQQLKATAYDFCGMRWGDTQMETLVEVLEGCKDLEDLDLSYNEIGDAGAMTLAGKLREMTCLQTLRLNNNCIGDAGAEKLRAALPGMTNLQAFFFDSNNMSHGAKAMLQAAAPPIYAPPTVAAPNRIHAQAGKRGLYLLEGKTSPMLQVISNRLRRSASLRAAIADMPRQLEDRDQAAARLEGEVAAALQKAHYLQAAAEEVMARLTEAEARHAWLQEERCKQLSRRTT